MSSEELTPKDKFEIMLDLEADIDTNLDLKLEDIGDSSEKLPELDQLMNDFLEIDENVFEDSNENVKNSDEEVVQDTEIWDDFGEKMINDPNDENRDVVLINLDKESVDQFPIYVVGPITEEFELIRLKEQTTDKGIPLFVEFNGENVEVGKIQFNLDTILEFLKIFNYRMSIMQVIDGEIVTEQVTDEILSHMLLS